ncbi:MAG: hypothetical protein BV459_02260 [Thermoplasmata archaeon M11B2D]|nr:MAG: hypothetical protein BV459_02260 [Thermoplasmata archaeon M11B2D]PNX53743.1 MAG: hypothetical protein BV458_03020 [Thermoplasmata archaeon M9B2D]
MIKAIKLKTIEARRYVEPDDKPRQIRIDHNSQISQVMNNAEKTLIIEFQYTASYGPIGMIKLDGTMFCEENEAKQLAKEWQTTRKMPDQFASTIHTAIMHTCVPEAVGIAKDLGLPPPIPLPQVRLGSDPKKGQSQSGIEVA